MPLNIVKREYIQYYFIIFFIYFKFERGNQKLSCLKTIIHSVKEYGNQIFSHGTTVNTQLLNNHHLEANTSIKHHQEIVGWHGKETLSNYT